MNKSTMSKALLASLMLGASAAQAGFIMVDSVPYAQTTHAVASSNNFIGQLAGLGVTNYTLGASLATDAAGSVDYYYYGSEAGYNNWFLAQGGVVHTNGLGGYQNEFGAPRLLGSVGVAAGLLDFRFCTISGVFASPACVSNAQNDALRYESVRSIALSIVGDSAWLFWDDSGAGPDDNHDDMVIRAVFTPHASVPEPGTLGLMGLGLLGFWLGTRRRNRAGTALA